MNLRLIFKALLVAACLVMAGSPAAHARRVADSMAPIDITPKGRMGNVTEHYGAGSLGSISTDLHTYKNTDDLYARQGSGEGFHDSGSAYNVQGYTNAPEPSSMNYTDQNFTFVPRPPVQEPAFAPPVPSGPPGYNVQGFDAPPAGNFYDGHTRPEWNNTRTMQEWRDQTFASAMPAVKDGAYFSGLDATPQQHEPYYVVVANNADWALMWQQHMGRQPPGRLMPGQVAVASILGPRRYTGYEARVKIIGERGDLIQVAATQASPAPQVAQEPRDNAPYAVLVIQAGSRGVEVLQNRAMNTGNYNYAHDPKAKSIAWDPVSLYTGQNRQDIVLENSQNRPLTGHTRAAPSDPR